MDAPTPSSSPALAQTSRAEQQETGRAWRTATARNRIAEVGDSTARDPIGILSAQNTDRLVDLVPLRRERMSESPFAFYRGAAAVMAADLARTPSTQAGVQSCGDAHLSNFGLFASRDRELIFDMNDFDETHPAPWEWDLKRLVTSVVILAQQIGLAEADAHAAATRTARIYRRAMGEDAAMTPTQQFYLRIKARQILDDLRERGAAHAQQKALEKSFTKATRNTSERALGKLTAVDDERGLHIVDQPPLTDRYPGFDLETARPLMEQYLTTVPEDIGLLLSRYHLQDGVLKVVGVGSVGTRCLLLLFVDADGAPLFLQIKEASSSVLEHWTQPTRWATPGHRVTAGQRMLQASGDPFLGHFTGPAGRAFYVRQFRDMKGGIDPATLTTARDIGLYGGLCGRVLARAHAQSGIAPAISAYLGTGSADNAADRGFADFALAYSEVNAADHAALIAASDEAWMPH